jgi:hypothetical protein
MTNITLTPQVTNVTISPRGGVAVVVQARPINNITIATRGLQGRQGNDGAPGARYTHTQSSPLSLWTIAHNLGFRPNVTVTTIGGQEVWGGEVLHLSANTLTITFDIAMAGLADCV